MFRFNHPFLCVQILFKSLKTDYLTLFYKYNFLSNPKKGYIIAGDFNPTSNGFRPAKLARYSKLKQIIKNPTRGSNILDLLFADISTFFETP